MKGLKKFLTDKIPDEFSYLGTSHQDVVSKGWQYEKGDRLLFGNSSIKSKNPLEPVHSNGSI